MPESIRSMLAEGRHRLALGRTEEVAALAGRSSRRLGQLVECLWDEDPGVASRAADALERASRNRPAILDEWKAALLGLLAEAQPKKLRWNLALTLPRLTLSAQECRRAAGILESYLDDSSSIVKTAALQGLADLTRQETSLLPLVLDLLRIHSRSGTPAMRARGRILLKRLVPDRKMP